MRVAVCLPQVPFERGGAEILCDELVAELRERDHEADLVTIPFKWYPGATVLSQALLWRLLDLSEANGRPVDRVIATKFPSYVVRHPRKVVWLVHQFRQAYELDGTELGQFGSDAKDRATRRAVHRLDARVLGEAERLYATSTNNAERLERSVGLTAQVLRHPPRALDYRCEGYGDFVLSVGRLDAAKRVELVLSAARGASWKLVVAGDGPLRRQLEEQARELAVDERVEFVGRVGDSELAALYARCAAVYYAPIDEDSGLVPYEAFLASKPVVTTEDAGGPLEVVEDGVNGRVCRAEAESLRPAFDSLLSDRAEAARLGETGRRFAETLSWDRVISDLLAE